MTVNIEYETEKELNIPYEEIINKVINEAADYAELPYEAELNVLLTDNESIHQINLETREMDRPTDVLSFPALEYNEPGDFSIISEDSYDFNPDTGELMLGDIVISVEKVIEQANAYGHSEERELGFLVAHSMLHLFGYDHMEEDERIVMEKKQEEILARCNILRG
ncbi:rRNA maturation RNase YbeY [[Clostridium] polysaccharolyticum]|jgi:probable rRNA maturation factor|uniref:Endoribonuclease YbeY n=1 Tax=[Clostridium] polysaccharolyticum TaxID=29364 RepID=A0A1I0AY20_9FIRM|nr:rRNA maturation RNase YbeY [[Clostridium] polysaccharolyticum]SES98523.1 probable rRNA maturation factor [[Clostridium] polysaccharolyticum]